MFTALLAVATVMLSTSLSCVAAQAQSQAAGPPRCYKFDPKEKNLLAAFRYPGNLSGGVYNSSQPLNTSWSGPVCSNRAGGPVVSIRHECSDLTNEWNVVLSDLLKGLENLVELNQLNINKCRGMTGTIPGSMIASLRSVALTGNNLTGTLHENWQSSLNLKYLDLSQNKISGSLPSAWNGLGGLDVLKLNENNITGSLPSVW